MSAENTPIDMKNKKQDAKNICILGFSFDITSPIKVILIATKSRTAKVILNTLITLLLSLISGLNSRELSKASNLTALYLITPRLAQQQIFALP